MYTMLHHSIITANRNNKLQLSFLVTILHLILLPFLFIGTAHSFVLGTTTTTSSRNNNKASSTTIVPMSTPSSSSSTVDTTTTHEERLQIYLNEHHISELPPAPKAAANYCPCQRSGDLLFLSGHLPFSSMNDGTTTLAPYTGRLGGTLQPSEMGDVAADPVALGYEAAKQSGLNIIATIREELGGSINDVEQIIKLFGLVQSSDDFHQQHLVMNGCSDLMTNIFGPIAGKHARSAVGTNALPLNSMIEIEAIVRLKPRPPS